jgi:hypothetical protein
MLSSGFSQCLLLKRHNETKQTCTNTIFEYKEVADKKEGDLQGEQFKKDHPYPADPLYLTVSANEFVIVYKLQRDLSVSFKCTPTKYVWYKDVSFEKCIEAMEKNYEINKKLYVSKPGEAFRWTGKK